MGLEELV